MDGHVKQFNMDLLDYASLKFIEKFFYGQMWRTQCQIQFLGESV